MLDHQLTQRMPWFLHEYLHFFSRGTSMQKKLFHLHISPQHWGFIMLGAGNVSVAGGLSWTTSWFISYRKSHGIIVFCIFQTSSKEIALTDIFLVTSILERLRNKTDFCYMFFSSFSFYITINYGPFKCRFLFHFEWYTKLVPEEKNMS